MGSITGQEDGSFAVEGIISCLETNLVDPDILLFFIKIFWIVVIGEVYCRQNISKQYSISLVQDL